MLLFQHCCHFVRKNLLTWGFKSVYGMEILSRLRSKANLAAESALSILLIPMWLGIQHIIISLWLDIESIDKNACISFYFWISWIHLCLPMCYFIDALLELTLCSSHIFWSGSDTEVVNVKMTINSRSKTPFNTVNFYIKQCHRQNTPLKDSLFLFVEISKRWSDSDSELYEVQPSSLQSKAMEIFHYSELPSGLISLLQIKEDCYQMFFVDIGLSYRGFWFDYMIHCWSAFSEDTLRIGNKFIGSKISVQSFVYHALHCFTEASS